MEFGLVAVWLAALLLLGLLARPAAAWLLPGLDHDALAIPLALAVLGVVGHLVGHVAFGWPALLAGLAALAGASYWAWGRVELEASRYAEASAVFAAAFLFMVGIRALDPAAAPLPVAIGEKMLDFGLLKSLLRAPTLPPEDMWYAGATVRYHYGGHMLSALLATLTFTAGRFAYNLALAGFYAALVVAAYGLASSIAVPYAASRRWAAAFGAFLVGVAGNLDTPARLLIWLLPDGPARSVAEALGYRERVLGWTPDGFFYFDASRVFPIDATDPNSFMAATEFPLFAWLNGDLHAHMMSQPFMLLLGALLLGYWRADGQPGRRALLLLGAVPPLVGFIGVVNVWSFPTAGALVALAVAFAPGEPTAALRTLLSVPAALGPRADGRVEELRRLALGAIGGLAATALGVVWTLPYWTVVVLGGPGMRPMPWGPWTPLGGFVVVQGAFLAVIGLFLFGATAAASDEPERLWAAGLAALGLLVLVEIPAWGFVVPIGLGAWWLLRRESPGFEWMLVLAGGGLVFLVEFVSLEGERFNVVFKYYAHVWLFWSVAAGVGLARLRAGWPAATRDVELPRWGTIGRILAAGVVLTTAVYAGFALPTHADHPGPAVAASGPTLDATAYVDVTYADEAAAIAWLDARDGRPTIVTAAPGGYWWRPDRGDGAAAPASLTGLPTVLGWFHERQYRGPADYQTRVEHVRQIYEGPAERQRTLLERYGVDYVYVGPAERARYDAITVGQLEAVSVAAELDGVTIYRVDRGAL